ncbi:hypothetical protein C5167_049498 [Papaver somniferum]|uniref:ATPase AAA-type core domain-containing protein n=1 Tax=Papaver somniferum TaxID=3469 RepID=A0A4Y7KME8_PAPSO|nr:hypothetical protein C5167_049498 [Papaver somniferum]
MAKACALGIVSALASATLGVEYAYADGPFNFGPFSSSSSSPSPHPPPEAAPSSDTPKEEESSSSKVRNDNPRTTSAGFDPEPLLKGAAALREISTSLNAKKAFDLMMKREETKMIQAATKKAEMDAMRAQFETERQKVLSEEKQKLSQQQAQNKAQMAQNEWHKARNQELVKMQEESALRLQAARQATEQQIQAQRLQTEREKANILRENIKSEQEAKARANALHKQLTEDLSKRELIDRAKLEQEKWVAAINTTFEHIGGGVKALLTDQNKLIVVVGGVTALAAGVYTTREGARVIWGYVDRVLGQPSLIRESSRGKYPWSGIFSRGISSLSQKAEGVKGNGFGDVVLHPSLHKRIEQLAGATANTKSHQAPFRNMLFYGPPGTGKTMAARELARKSYAYADGPFNFGPFSSSSSSPSPHPPPEAAPSSDTPKEEESSSSKVRNDNPRTTSAGFDPEPLLKGAAALREISV